MASDEVTTTATGQQSATDNAELAFQPGYWQPEEQANPLERVYVDYTDDPIGHAKWKQERADAHKAGETLKASESES
jgi:hypothetical protein